MEVLRFWEEEGVAVPEPYKRHIKIMLAPDRRNAPELTFSQVLIYPESKTDYHAHDRPELIVVVSGRGKSICDGKEIGVQADMALWIKSLCIHAQAAALKLPGFNRQDGAASHKGRTGVGPTADRSQHNLTLDLVVHLAKAFRRQG